MTSCHATKSVVSESNTVSRDSIILIQRDIVREPIDMIMYVDKPCDELGNLKPFKQVYNQKGVSLSLSNKDGAIESKIALKGTTDTTITDKKTSTVEVIKSKTIETIKYRVPKIIIWILIITGIYIVYRVVRVFYPIIRFLPY